MNETKILELCEQQGKALFKAYQERGDGQGGTIDVCVAIFETRKELEVFIDDYKSIYTNTQMSDYGNNIYLTW